MIFRKYAWFWITNFGYPDISLGVHISMAGRVDLHIANYMISFGKIPVYMQKNGKLIAVSNSYHTTKKGPIRAGCP